MPENRLLEPVFSEIVPAEYIARLTQTQRRNIESTEFIPPRPGDRHFGKFRVTYRTPVLTEVDL